MFANKSRSRVIDLKNTLTSTKRGTKSVSEYLQFMKHIAAEIKLAGKCPPIKAFAAVKMAQIDIQMAILARPPMMMVPIQEIAWSAKFVISLATRLSSVIEARNSLHLRLNLRQTLLIHP
ncbi:hypothetical protein COLO4_38478 [Corchorus olitorius]|uniref:Uncharacterized protein n=1 Tax=Corchorus olitorius TaxID=93759 RepID=A0A1R3FUS9_9ROSI|nr:hypothetical protein COLO4_38478 [Corchorus olitorius]